MEINRNLLAEGLMSLAPGAPGDALGRLARYVEEIELWNPAYGLVNDSGDALIVRHILDSLAGLPRISAMPRARVADVGSGAGLPGIPLAILLPGSFFSLVEPSGRRCAFLENQKAILPLPNAEIIQKRAEELRGSWDIITFRGFRPLESGVVAFLAGLLSPGGAIVAYKGRRGRIEEEIAAIADLDLVAEVEPIKAPFLDEERHLVILRKRGGAGTP
jgi:16S rRNA (guanine527-N7)-methyltransferase